MAERPYSRVYWELLDDPKFQTIIPEVRHLGTWTLLLVVADMAWPVPAYLPPVPKASIRALSDCGLVDLLPGGRYRLHGLDAERERRANSARTGGLASGNARRTTVERPSNDRRTTVERLVNLDETSREEPSRDETRRPLNGLDDPAVAFQERTGEFPGGKMLPWINELADTHGEARLAAMIRSTPMIGHNARDYLVTVRNKLRAEDYAADQAERADEKRRLAAKRAPLPDNPVTVMIRDAVRARYAQEGES